MEDMTARIIRALRKAAGVARCAEDATELNELADALDAEGAPIPAPEPEVDIDNPAAVGPTPGERKKRQAKADGA